MNLILNCKYEEIAGIVNRRVEEFFKIYDLIGENENRDINNTPLLNSSQSGTNSLNQIFKKILLENNSMSSTKINKPTSILCNSITGKAGDAAANSNFSNHRTRVLICSDATEESEISGHNQREKKK